MNNKEKQIKYWRTNIRYVLILLFFWFMVSFGSGGKRVIIEESNFPELTSLEMIFLIKSDEELS